MGRTEETRVSSHVCALEHLRKASECTHQAFDHLKRSLCTGAQAVGKTVGIVGVSVHAWLSHAAVHATHAAHTAHTAHAPIHRSVATAEHGVAHPTQA